MKFKIIIFILSIQTFCCAQNVEVSVKNIYIDSTETKSIISSIHCEVKNIEIDNNKKIRLLFAEGKDESGKRYKVDGFDYFGYDDMVLKNTFPVTFFSKKRIKSLLDIYGTLRYFTPTTENGGLKIVENPKQKNNVDIYKSQDNIKVIILNIDDFLEAEKNQEAFNILLAKVVSENRLNKKLFKKCIKLLISDHKTYNWNSNQYFAFYIEDKDDKLAGLHTSINNSISHDGGGTNRFGMASLVTRRFLQNIEPERKIVLEIENSKSVKDFGFVINNISMINTGK